MRNTGILTSVALIISTDLTFAQSALPDRTFLGGLAPEAAPGVIGSGVPIFDPSVIMPDISTMPPAFAPNPLVQEPLRSPRALYDPVIGSENVGFVNGYTEALNVDVVVGGSHQTLLLAPREIATVKLGAASGVTAVIGTGGTSFVLAIERGKLYRLHAADGKYVISEFVGE
ncbi:hypothetical protein M2267_002662 [Ensifer sp. KUDG1]|uniref:hypothetical protein n=1 Tax=Ensifer sp. KUDG1 TaxID=3373919 RepID=UPI003D21D535